MVIRILKKKKISRETLRYLFVPLCFSSLGSGTQLPLLFYLSPSCPVLAIPWIMGWPFNYKHWPLGLCVVPSLDSGTHHWTNTALTWHLAEQYPPSHVCWWCGAEGGGRTNWRHSPENVLVWQIGATGEGFPSLRWGQWSQAPLLKKSSWGCFPYVRGNWGLFHWAHWL